MCDDGYLTQCWVERFWEVQEGEHVQRLATLSRRGRVNPAGMCFVVRAAKTMHEGGQGVQEEMDKMGPRWWKKSQRSFSNPSLR